MEEKAKGMAELLKLLANEHRLLLLCALGEQPSTVGELHQFVPNITTSALSQHLNQLKRSGILDSKKQGLHVTYQIADTRVLELLKVMKQYYCQPEEGEA